jgi:hypothetical protein
VVFCTFYELKLLKTGLPTDIACEVFRVDKEVEQGFCFREENVLEVGSEGGLEIGIGDVLDGGADCPNEAPRRYDVQSLNFLLVAVDWLSLGKKSPDEHNETLGDLQLDGRHGFHPLFLQLQQDIKTPETIVQQMALQILLKSQLSDSLSDDGKIVVICADVDHTASTDGSGRGCFEILDLEEHS